LFVKKGVQRRESQVCSRAAVSWLGVFLQGVEQKRYVLAKRIMKKNDPPESRIAASNVMYSVSIMRSFRELLPYR